VESSLVQFVATAEAEVMLVAVAGAVVVVIAVIVRVSLPTDWLDFVIDCRWCPNCGVVY
jgi:hypothetical protein